MIVAMVGFCVFFLIRWFNIVYNYFKTFIIMIVFCCTCTNLDNNRLGGFSGFEYISFKGI